MSIWPAAGGQTVLALADGLRLDPATRGCRLAELPEPAWPSVLRRANEHLLGPALAVALAEADSYRLIPDDARKYLALLRDANDARNTLIRRQTLELVAALNARGITPMLVKGALTLFADPQRDPAARMMADIDVLVPPARRGVAEATLDALGYRAVDRYPEGHHAVGEFARAGEPASVDLHLELIDQPYILSAGEMIAPASTREADGVRILIPASTERLLHVLLHAQIHHLGNYYRGRISLNQLYDFATIACEHGTAVDWARIDRRMREHRLAQALDSYLTVAGRLFALPWPLDRPPEPAGLRHARRCLLRLRLPALQEIAAPAANLRAAFAWHRMRAGYGGPGGPLSWKAQHAWQYLRRHDARQAISRLLR